MTKSERLALAESFAKEVLRAYNRDLNPNRPPIDEPVPIREARVDDAIRAAEVWLEKAKLEKTK